MDERLEELLAEAVSTQDVRYRRKAISTILIRSGNLHPDEKPPAGLTVAVDRLMGLDPAELEVEVPKTVEFFYG